MRCGGYKFHNLLIPLSRTTNSIKFTHLTKKIIYQHLLHLPLFDEISILKLFSSPVVHVTAVTFQWTFLCYGFAKSIQYASPCCMCESLIRPIRTYTSSYNITQSHYLQLHLVLYIQHNAIHFHPNPIALCCQRDLAISHSHRYISVTVLQLA